MLEDPDGTPLTITVPSCEVPLENPDEIKDLSAEP